MRDRESMGVAWKGEMNPLRRLRGLVCLPAAFSLGDRLAVADGLDWPQWRGPLWNGIAPNSPAPSLE